MDNDLLETLEGCDEEENEESGDGGIGISMPTKHHQSKHTDQSEDGMSESLYADSEFAEAIAKAAETSASVRTASSKLKASEVSKLSNGFESKRKRTEGIARGPNHPPGGRLAPMPDNIQVN